MHQGSTGKRVKQAWSDSKAVTGRGLQVRGVKDQKEEDLGIGDDLLNSSIGYIELFQFLVEFNYNFLITHIYIYNFKDT